MSLFSTPGSVFIKVTLLKSRQRHCSQHPDFALKWTIVAGRQYEAQTIKFPTAHTLLGKPMVFNSLHAEVIYTFQFSKAEIARNQRCHSEGRS